MPRSKPLAAPPARFLTGSTMRHVVVMTLSGSLGLSFMFLVDFMALFWVGQLRVEALVAAIGYAWTIQFFLMSISIGMNIGANALVSRALGADDRARARRIATSAMIYMVLTMSTLAAAAWLLRRPLLEASGAQGEVLEVAYRFLGISLPSLPMIAVGMCSGAVLRALGDAWRTMATTLAGGIVAILLDPVLILWAGWGVDGAAFSIVVSRGIVAGLGFWWVVRHHDMLAPPSLRNMRNMIGPYVAIAVPALLAQMSNPFGNWALTRAMAEQGDSAVAGLGVVLRLMILVFGGIFALSGAIGGIFGQNYGARRLDRVATAYRDALIFCVLYALVAWVLLFAASGAIVRGFGLSEEGAEVVLFFCRMTAWSLALAGAVYVAGAAFNNLGRPILSTASAWTRDAVITLPAAFWLGHVAGAEGVLVAQLLANVSIGLLAGWLGWRHIARLRRTFPAA